MSLAHLLFMITSCGFSVAPPILFPVHHIYMLSSLKQQIFDKRTIFLLVILFFVAASIIFYSTYRCNNAGFVDPLQQYPFGGKNSHLSDILDGWSLLHFTLFMILGYYFPDKFLFITILGILWEVFEYATSKTTIPQLKWIRGLSLCGSDADKKGGHFYYAKLSDIFMNTSGFLLGRYFATRTKS